MDLEMTDDEAEQVSAWMSALTAKIEVATHEAGQQLEQERAQAEIGLLDFWYALERPSTAS